MKAKKPLSPAEKVALLEKISRDATDCTLLPSITWGEPVEVWNLVTCWIQNAIYDKNDLLSVVESALSFESKEIGAYFRKLGIPF